MATGSSEEWTPAFPGQRPPFERGNTASVVHGAFSQRRTGPVAERIVADLLADPETPEHLHEPLFLPAIEAWAQAEAVCRQLRAFVADQPIEDAMAEVATEKEITEVTGTRSKRVSHGRRVTSALDALRKWEATAANARGRLGLDPASAAKVGRDIAARRYLDAATPLDAALATIEDRRRQALGPGHQEAG
jgi:hypothetical protein